MTRIYIFLTAMMIGFLQAKLCMAQGQFIECYLNDAKLPCLKATIEDHEITMLIDSGASHNVICSSTAYLLNLERSNDFDDWPSIETLANRKIRVVGCINNENEPVVVANLSKLSEICSSKIDGILGLPFLQNKTLAFRGDKVLLGHTRLNQEQSEKCCPSETDDFGRIHLRLSDVIPGIRESHRTLIDSGMNQPISVEKTTFAKLCSSGRITQLDYLSDRIRFDCDSVGVECVQSGLLWQSDEATSEERRLVHTSSKNKVGVPWLMGHQLRIDFASGKVFAQIRQETAVAIGNEEPSAIRR